MNAIRYPVANDDWPSELAEREAALWDMPEIPVPSRTPRAAIYMPKRVYHRDYIRLVIAGVGVAMLLFGVMFLWGID